MDNVLELGVVTGRGEHVVCSPARHRLLFEDWIRHYGPLWSAFFAAKRVFDPDNVLTPGQGIFAPPS